MTKRRDPQAFGLIVAKAARCERLSVSDIIGRRRTQPLAEVRFAIMVAARGAGYGVHEIAKQLGRSDHTTVLNGLDRAEALLKVDPGFSALVSTLEMAA